MLSLLSFPGTTTAGNQQPASHQPPCEEDVPCSLKTDVPDSTQSKVTHRLLLSQSCPGSSCSSQKQFLHSLRPVWGWGGQGTHECLSKLLGLRILISKVRAVCCTEFGGFGGLYLRDIIQGLTKQPRFMFATLGIEPRALYV